MVIRDGEPACQLAVIGWHAGLPADFTLPLDAWMGQRCGACKGDGALKYLGVGKAGCHQCRGIGRVNAIGPKLLAAAPVRVEGLRFTGVEPWRHRGRDDFWWFNFSQSDGSFVPPEIFDLLEGYDDWGHGTDDGAGKSFPDLAAAHDALARAAIRWTALDAGQLTQLQSPPS